MGMIVVFFAASDATIERIVADPPLLWQLVAPDDPEMYSDARAASAGMLDKLFGRAKTVEPLALAEHEGEMADLDKAWDGIHFLLNRGGGATSSLLGFLTEGGTEIPGQEVGYGPARVFRAAQVRAIASELSSVTDEELRTRYDAAAMVEADIYPQIWDRTPPEDDPLGYLMENLGTLRSLMRKLVDSGSGLVLTLQ
jgi:hypothetical protein